MCRPHSRCHLGPEANRSVKNRIACEVPWKQAQCRVLGITTTDFLSIFHSVLTDKLHRTVALISLFIRDIQIACQWRIPNALTISRLTANAIPSPDRTVSSDRDQTHLTASTFEHRNPNWQSDRLGPTSDRCPLIRSEMTLSKSFPGSFSKHISQNAEGERAVHPFLTKSTSLVSFQPRFYLPK